MRNLIITAMLFVFMAASSGLAKTVHAHNQLNTVASVSSQMNLSDGSKCCAVDHEDSEKQAPRCIGDNCAPSIPLPAVSAGFVYKLAIKPSYYIGMSVDTAFLRPPIA